MSSPTYSIYVDGKIQEAFTTGTSTSSRKEAEDAFDSMMLVATEEGTIIELRVSSRGITSVLKECTVSAPSFSSDNTPGYSYTNQDNDDNKAFQSQIKNLHKAGFSVPEIAEITGKTYRVVSYNLKRLSDTEGIESHGRGRPVGDATRRRKAVTIQMYEDNYDYLKEKFGNVTSAVNDLIDKYRNEKDSKGQ